MLCEKRPVEPACFVILAIGVVVSTLCSPHFVTHEHHRHAHRKHGYGQKVLHLPIPEFLHAGIIGGTFNAAVPASVVVGPVAVVFAVCFVVLVIVGDEVVKGEAVMASHEVNALLSLAFLMTVDCRATKQPVGKALTESFSPRKKLRTSSRNRPFHSFQLSPMKLPT